MKSMHLLLNEAEHSWREDVRRDFPLRSDTPVIRKTSPNGRDWTFSTDLKRIFAHISGDESLQKKFEAVVARYWDGNPEELARETLHYLLFHELYHPLEAPFSVAGNDNDNKRIHQAIRRGVLQAEPGLGPLEQVVKVQVSQNGVKDFILDNRFAIDNKAGEYVRGDIIPTWDLLELQEFPSKTNFYTVTRFLYGVMYGPQAAHEFFEGKSGKEGSAVAEKALAALIGKPVQLPKKKGMVAKAKSLLGGTSEQETYERLQEYVTAIRGVFSGQDRYEGIKRFMAVLGPYVEKGMPQGRPDMQGEGSGSSPQDILQDLLDDMTPQEQAQFVQGLAQENPTALEQTASQMPKKPDSAKPGSSDSSVDEMRNLDVLATHEFYKRNHPSVRIIGGRKVGESLVVGKQEYWDLKKSSVLTEDQLARVNLQRIDALQRRTRLPWLIDLGNGTFRLNEYELKQRDIKDIVYVDAHIDVPDVVEFYLDDSKTMYFITPEMIVKSGGKLVGEGFQDGHRIIQGYGLPKFWPNNESQKDTLCSVVYGVIDGMRQAAQITKKRPKLRFTLFADEQISTDYVDVEEFWRGHIPTLRIFYGSYLGEKGTELDIQTNTRQGSTGYFIITDGELSSNTEREAAKMKRIAQSPNNHVVLFEIGGTYDLGNAVRNEPSIVYRQVHDKDKMLQAGLEVLLSK